MTEDTEKEEVDFPLTVAFDYGHKGKTESATFIRLVPPSAKQLKHCTELKQAFYRAMAEIQEDNKDREKQDVPDDSKLEAGDIIKMIYVSKSVEMTSVLVTAIELLSSGVATVDGETKLTKPLISAMSMDDLENMVGAYLANFILRSLLAEMR